MRATPWELALAPVLLVQGRRSVRRIGHFEAAAGEPHGTVAGPEPALRLVVIGESTAVGVGAPTHELALAGWLAAALRDRVERAVTWSACGRGGATARQLTAQVVPAALGPSAPDVVVVTAGVNDVLRRRTPDEWRHDLAELITALRAGGAGAVVVAGMPPLGHVPGLPQPLRFALDRRARALDRVTRQVVPDHGASYAAIDAAALGDAALFAADGFHPSPTGYRHWAAELANAVPTAPLRTVAP